MTIASIDYLTEVEQVRQLKARYFRTMDTKDWNGMRRVFADDVVMDTSQAGGPVITGGDAFVEYLEHLHRASVTVHHGHMPEIEITSSTTAVGIWALQDTIVWSDGSRLVGYGHYHERYEKVEGEWLIKSSTLTRILVDQTPAGS